MEDEGGARTVFRIVISRILILDRIDIDIRRKKHSPTLPTPPPHRAAD